jgi:hypothetical protein
MGTDFIEAARSQLATWLKSELHASYPTLTVIEQWPVPGRKLDLPSISIVMHGEPRIAPHSPAIHETTPTVSPYGLVLYSYGSITLDVQLDAWAEQPAQRNALSKAVSNAANIHPVYSIPIVDAMPELRRNPGLVLKLAGFYDILADYQIEQVDSPEEDSDAAQTGEWRATFTGSVEFLAVTEEQQALLKQIVVTTTLNGGTPGVRTIP